MIASKCWERPRVEIESLSNFEPIQFNNNDGEIGVCVYFNSNGIPSRMIYELSYGVYKLVRLALQLVLKVIWMFSIVYDNRVEKSGTI